MLIEYRLASLIVQAVGHSTEHSQISAIITQLGLEPPDMSGWQYMDEIGELHELGEAAGGTQYRPRRICGITLHSAHINLMFASGTELPDPDRLLVGNGKRARHIKITIRLRLRSLRCAGCWLPRDAAIRKCRCRAN